MPKSTFDPEATVNKYFEYVRQLRNGQAEAIDKLVDLWADDGIFEFAGAPPVTGTYKGKNAIHVLYKNRHAACGMPLKLTAKAARASAADVALGVVDTQVHRMRAVAETRSAKAAKAARSSARTQRVAAGWTTVIGAADQRGYQVTGNHAFTFRDGKIAALKVTVSPKPAETPGLSLKELKVEDIGKLSLAAWAVV